MSTPNSKGDGASIYSTSSSKPLIGNSSASVSSSSNQKSTSSKIKSFFSGLGEPPTAAYDREQALKNPGKAEAKSKQQQADILGYGAGLGSGLERK